MKIKPSKNPIMIALDMETDQQALALIQQLEEAVQRYMETIETKPHSLDPFYVKIGMQLFYAEGPSLIEHLKERGLSIFLDLKLYDIPTTVKGAAQSLTRLGVDMFNVHCAGGVQMMEAALEGVNQGLTGQEQRPKIIGVTHLTSMSQQVMNEEIGIPGKVEEAVLHYARLTQKAGLDGVVCSPMEVPAIKQACGADFLTVTPGIRPAHTATDDQVRVSTPREALELGTDYMVIGRAITKAHDPGRIYIDILKELNTQEKRGEA